MQLLFTPSTVRDFSEFERVINQESEFHFDQGDGFYCCDVNSTQDADVTEAAVDEVLTESGINGVWELEQ